MKKLLLSIVALIITCTSFGQPLTGTKNIPADYATIAAAVAALNTNGVGSGGVIFNVAAGHTETLPNPTAGLITATGTVAEPVLFQKSGAGANPVITAANPGTSTTVDYIICIAGGDYITFDAIDLQENTSNTTSTMQMEWGYALVRKTNIAPFDGCQNVTIKNCVISLNKTNTASIGIYAGNHISTDKGSLTITATTDAMNNCKFFGNTISNCYGAISLSGYNAPTPYILYDQNNEIGVTAGNTISNMGAGNVSVRSIYSIYQNGVKVGNNNISMTAGGATTTVYGIFTSTGTSSNVDIYNNTISVSFTSGTYTSTIYGINNAMGSTASSNTININNNTIQNCNLSTVTSGGFQAIVNTGTAATVNIFSNNISSNTLAGSGDMYGIYNNASMGTNTLNFYSNTINGNIKSGTSGNLYCTRAITSTIVYYSNNIYSNSITGGTGTLYGYYNVSSPVTESYYNNIIHDLTHGGSGNVYGISIVTASGVKTTYGNLIYNLNSAGGIVYGYNSGFGTPHNFYNNRIYGLTSTTTSGIVYGITFFPTTLNCYNNYISDLTAPNATSINAVIGMNLASGGSTYNVFYNTIYLNASSTSATNFGSSGIYANTGTTLDLRNNIIINSSTPLGTGVTAAYRRSNSSLTSYANSSNNNDFYAGIPGASNLVYCELTTSPYGNPCQTIGEFKTYVGPIRDAASFTENPPFVNIATTPYDLHMQTTVATQCESGGVAVTTPIVITTDYDGDTRNPVPDVGADEFAGIPLDLIPPVIVYTNLTNICTAAPQTLTATITDASGVPVAGIGLPVLYYKVNSGGWSNQQGVSIGSNQYTFTTNPVLVPGDVVSYYVVAQDMATTPNVGANPSPGASGFTANPPAAGVPPTTPNQYSLLQTLTGIKTVGAGGDFATIAAAIAALNTGCVGTSGVTFNVAAGHAETFATLSAGVITTTFGSSSSPIIFQKSGAGANPVITAAVISTPTATDGIIKFAGCDYITFDGIDLLENAANISPNLTDWGYAILKESGTNGSQNITIKNCTVTLNKANTSSVGIYLANHTPASATSLTVTAASGTNSNERIFNNTISNVYKGISLTGYSDITPHTFYDQNNEIGKDGANTITNFGGGGNAPQGIYAIYQNGLILANNSITGGNGTTTNVYGIWTSTGTNSNLDIYGNTITLVSAATVTTLYGINNDMGGSGTNNTVNIYNNTVTNCSFPTATSAPFFAIYQMSGVYKFNCYGNIISNNTLGASGVSATGTFSGIYSFGGNTISGSLWKIYDNTISGNSRIQSVTGGGDNYYIYNLTSGLGLEVYGNTVDNNTAASYGVTAGIYISNSATVRNIYNNTVKNILNSNGTVYGIYTSSGTSSFIFNNKVANLNGIAPGSLVYGIYINSGWYNYIYNNFISELFSPVATNALADVGLYINGGSSIFLNYISYNTIYMDASSTAGTFGTTGIYTSTTPLADLQNNIIVNISAPGASGLTVALQRSDPTINTYSANSDNNDFYAGTPGPANLIYYDGTNSDQTLNDFKARVAPRDAYSITENPPFVNKTVSPYDLHLNTTVATQCESGGKSVSVPVAISADYDYDSRYPNSGYPNNTLSPAFDPDMGADEFGGLFLDLTPPVITYIPLGNTNLTSERTLVATITDINGVPVSGLGLPVLYWKVNSSVPPFTAATATSLGSDMYQFSFGAGVIPGDVIYYYVAAQDENTPPNVGVSPFAGASGFTANPPACSTPPTTPNSYTIVIPLSGTKTVGTGGDYSSLTGVGGLFETINGTVLSGNLIANIISDLSEDGTNGLNEWIESGTGGYTLTIKSDAAVNRDISGSYAEGLFRINGADRVTIDGSIGGVGRYLSFYNIGPIHPYKVFEFFDGSSYNTIKNCFISGGSNGMPVAIDAEGGSSGIAGFNNNIFDNNVIESVAYGIYIWGQTSDVAHDNQITNNIIGSTVLDRHVRNYCITTGYADNTLIEGNEIIGHSTADGSDSQTGIYMYQGSTNTKVRKNKIHDFYYDGNLGWGVHGIRYNSDATSQTEISNNIIYSLKSDGDASFITYNPSGIYIESGGNCQIVYNTIYLYGASLTDDYDGFSAGITIKNGVTSLDIRNNVIHNSMTAAYGTTCKTYAIYSLAPNSAFTFLDYNDYFVNGINPNIGFYGSDRSTLAAWKTATGLDANTQNVNPLFSSLTDLHSMSPALYKGAYPIPGVTDDFSGNIRFGPWPSNPPTIGAYEEPQISGGPATNITLTSATLNGTINAVGYYTVTNPVFEYGLTTSYTLSAVATPGTITGSANTLVSADISVLLPNTTYHYRLNATWGGNIFYGLDNTFTTSVGPPSVVTDPATSITQTAATLNGTVNPNNSSATVTFEFGTTTAYGQIFTADESPVTGSSNTPVTYGAASLTTNTIYHYRAVGTNANGTTNGLDQMFELVPTPTITGPANVCAGTSGNVYTTEAGKTNYAWIISAGGTITSGGGSSNNTVTVTWNTAGGQTVSVNYQNSFGVSAPLPTIYSVTVDPLLTAGVTITASANPVCVGISVTFTAIPTNGGTTPSYQWYKGSTPVGSGGTTYSYIPVNGDVITVVMISNAAPCLTGSPATSNAITMTVNPIPYVTNSPLSKTICSGTSTNIVLTANLPGTTFSWTANGTPNVTGYSNGTGNVISQILNNVGYTVETVTYHITPTANGCNGPVTDYVVIVYPVPDISTTPLSKAICSGASTNIVLTSHITGTTFSWTASGSPNVTGYSNGTGNLINQTLINIGYTIEVVTYHITPTANGCTGPVSDYVVTVYPVADVSITPLSQSICSGATTNILLTSHVIGTNFSWTANGSPNVTGYSNGTGNLIMQTLINSGNTIETVTYHITPTANGCTGIAVDYIVVVYPLLPANVTIAASANPVCAGTGVTFTATPANGGSTPSYQWYNGINPVGSNSPIYTSSTLADGDVIKVVMTSNATPCLTGSPATSNTITMSISASVAASVTIAADQNNVCAGTLVTFTPTPVGGGATPSYQWFRNTVAVGTGITYSYVPANGDQVYVIMTSSLTCATGSPATSNTVTMTVNPLLPVSVTIAASLNPVCTGTSVTFTATPFNGGSTPSYQWYNGSAPVGSGGATYSYAPVNGDVITVVMTSSASPCPTGSPATSNAITMIVNPLIPVSVIITASSNPTCAGTSVCYTATVMNGGSTPVYQWKVNSINVGTNSSVFCYVPANGDIISCQVTSSLACASPNPATSNAITMTIIATVAASVSIVPDQNNVCAGTMVTFTPAPVGGGATPAYEWFKNTVAVGTGSTYSYVPANGDQVYVIMTSSLSCATGSPATSNMVIMTVNPILTAAVTIVATANPVCAGTTVTFTATPVNGGTTPAYQWYNGSIPVGSGGAAYSYIPVNGDMITVVMTANAAPCLTGSPATSNAITMTVNPILPASVTIASTANTICAGTSVTFTATPVNGGTSPSYQWYKGINPVGGNSPTYTSSTLANGDVIHVVMTSNASPCLTGSPSTSNTITMTVNPLPVPSITGPAQVCQNVCPVTFTTEPGMTGYTWAVSPGGVNLSGQLTNTATFCFNGIGPQWVSVTYQNGNGCAPLTPTVFPVFVNTMPVPTITGPATACTGTTGVIYSTEAGMTGYNWIITAGGTITSGSGTNIINVSWNTPGAQTVSVNYTSVSGCTPASPVTLNVTVSAAPVPTITGPSPVCNGSTGNVYVTEPGKTGYAWSVSGGGTITAGGTANDNTASVTWTTVGTWTVSVNYVNAAGCTAASPTIYNVLVKASPVPVITGPASVCAGSTGTIYSTEAGMTGYFWFVSPGGTITSSNLTNSITVTWYTAGSQNVNVWYTNADGCTAINPTLYNVTVNALPVPTITGPNTACNGSTGNMYTTQTGMTGYSWAVSAGGTITAGTGTNTISVTWNVVGAQTVSVNYTNANGCTATTPTVYNVTVNPMAAPTITGPASVCAQTTGNIYTTQTGMTSYLWNVSAGGTITAGSGTNTITVTWNTAGAQIVNVNYTNSSGCTAAAPTVYNVTVNPRPTPTITGPVTVCAGTTGNVYTTQTGMTGYTWTISAGGSITGGAGTSSITVTWNTSGAQTISVNYTNASGCLASVPTVYNVTVNPMPVPTITGPNTACTGATGNVYTTESGMTGYTWSVSAGGTVTAGTGTNSITITWNVVGAQTVSVNYTNPGGCTALTPTIFNVTVSSMPAPTITGYNSLCVNSGYAYYNTETGMSNYTWNISSGGAITAGNGTSQIQVLWNIAGAQWVSVNYTNPNGCTAPSPTVFNVTVNPLPDPAGSITGTATVCAGAQGISYSTTPIANTTYYVWILPAGATIASGAGTTSITVNFATNATSGNITVVGNNVCGNGTSSPPFPVTVTQLPSSAGTISGITSVCVGTSGVIYTVGPIANATGYIWTVPPGATIVAGNNTNNITVDFSTSASSGIITVYGTNSCGNGTVSPDLNITVNPIPPAPVVTSVGETLTSSAPEGNQWYFEGVPIAGATGQTHIALNSGYYWAVVTLNGCSSDTSNHEYIIIIGMEPLQSENYSVYPVPNDGRFKVSITCTYIENINIKVYNTLGVVISEMRNVEVNGTTVRSIDLRPAPSGIYSVVIENDNKRVIRKILINQ